MPAGGAPGHVEVFVTELKLERDGKYAIGCARSLWQDIQGGQSLDPTQVATLVDVIATTPEYEVRSWTIKALTVQALRTDDGELIAIIAGAGAESFSMCLRADVRLPIGGRVLDALLRLTTAHDDAGQQELAQRLGASLFMASDIVPARDRLVGLLGIAPRGVGHKRVSVAAAAARCIFEAMVQDNAQRRASAATSPSGATRAELERAAVEAFGPKLEALAANDGTAGHDARSVLVAVAARKERWGDVDAYLAARRGPDGARAIALGLLRASHDVTFFLVPRDPNQAAAAFVGEIVRRVMTLRPELRKPDLKVVDTSLAGDAYKVCIRLSTAPDAATLVAQLLVAPPKKRHALHLALIDRVREDPALARHLPPVADVPQAGPRQEIAALRGLALLRLGDAAGMRDHFDALRRSDLRLSAAIATIANASSPSLAPHLALVAALLDDSDPATRWWACYFVHNVASKERAELAPFAVAILRRVTDTERSKGERESVAVQGRTALRAALAVTRDRAAFVAAAMELLSRADGKARSALRVRLRDVLPEALAQARQDGR